MNGTDALRARVDALEEDVRELRQLKLDVVVANTVRLESDLKDFRQQVRGEMAALNQNVDHKFAKSDRIQTWILRTLVVALLGLCVSLVLIVVGPPPG